MIFGCLDRNVPSNQLAREIAFLGDTLDPWVGRRQKWGYSSCGSSGPGAKHLMGPNAPDVSWRHKAWAVSLHLGPGTAARAGMGLAGSDPGPGTEKTYWPAEVAKSSEHQIYQRMWKTIQTSSSYFTNFNNFMVCRSHSIALKKCSTSRCFFTVRSPKPC